MSSSGETPEDDDLARRIRRRDRNALAEYLARRQAELVAFIRKRMSDGLRKKIEPEDIFQELTVSTLAAIDTAEDGDWDPFSWLCHHAERRIVDAHRRHFGAQKRSASREAAAPSGVDTAVGDWGDVLAASLTSPSSAFSRREKEYHMLQALDGLPPDSREALRLRYVEGLPSKEIATRLGRTDGAVRVLLTRSLQKLQEILGQNDEFQTLLANVKRGESRE